MKGSEVRLRLGWEGTHDENQRTGHVRGRKGSKKQQDIK